jgi:hypothetical protein
MRRILYRECLRSGEETDGTVFLKTILMMLGKHQSIPGVALWRLLSAGAKCATTVVCF